MQTSFKQIIKAATLEARLPVFNQPTSPPTSGRKSWTLYNKQPDEPNSSHTSYSSLTCVMVTKHPPTSPRCSPRAFRLSESPVSFASVSSRFACGFLFVPFGFKTHPDPHRSTRGHVCVWLALGHGTLFWTVFGAVKRCLGLRLSVGLRGSSVHLFNLLHRNG